MACRKRTIREVASSHNSFKQEAESAENSDFARPSNGDGKPEDSCKKHCVAINREHSSALFTPSSMILSPDAVKEAGLKILLETERLVNPQHQSDIARNEDDGNDEHEGENDTNNDTSNSNNKTRQVAAGASLNLPLVPDQFSPHKAWSEQTAKWSYDVLDHLQLPREIVYLSMHILEKALLASDSAGGTGGGGACSDNNLDDSDSDSGNVSNDSDDSSDDSNTAGGSEYRFGITNKHEYEKIAITSLYLAVRLSTRQTPPTSQEPGYAPLQRKLQISELLSISGSTWTEQEIQECSSLTLESLGLWKNKASDITNWNFQLHQAMVQATPHSFCKLLFFGFHKKGDDQEQQRDGTMVADHAFVPRQTRLAWLELALYLIELSVCDGSCHRLLPSVVALSSLQAACKILQAKPGAPPAASFQASKHVIEETLRKAKGVSELPNTTFVANRLEYIYQLSQNNGNISNGTQGNNPRRNAGAGGRNGRSNARIASWSCPTLVMDDDGEEEAEKQQQQEAAAFVANNRNNDIVYATRGTIASQTEEDRRPIQYIQCNLDMEQASDRKHRPISPCPMIVDHIHRNNSKSNMNNAKKAAAASKALF